MRVNIEETGRAEPRFRISETGIGIEEKQLKPYEFEFSPPSSSNDENNIYFELQQESDDGKEIFIFEIRQKPFRIT